MEATLNQQARTFRLADAIGTGVACDGGGCFVGETPLLERVDAAGAKPEWRPRPLPDLNAALSRRYGLAVDLASKLAGLAAVGRALDLGDIVRARIAALHLQLPDPPPLAKAAGADDILALAYRLQASGLLDKAWDETKHPRWPAQSPDSAGGRFAPAGEGAADAMAAPAPPKPSHPVQHSAPQPSPLATALARKPQRLSRARIRRC